MTELPCYDCKHKRYGKDVGDSMRNVTGFYVCIEDPVTALILNKSALETIKQIGCQKYEKKGVME